MTCRRLLPGQTGSPGVESGRRRVGPDGRYLNQGRRDCVAHAGWDTGRNEWTRNVVITVLVMC